MTPRYIGGNANTCRQVAVSDPPSTWFGLLTCRMLVSSVTESGRLLYVCMPEALYCISMICACVGSVRDLWPGLDRSGPC